MPPLIIPPQSPWLDDAVRHLDMLFAEVTDYADEGDVRPTLESLDVAKQVLIKCRNAHAPKIGLTVNGEFALAWESGDDRLRAYARPDGSVQFFRNKTAIDESTFSTCLTSAPE